MRPTDDLLAARSYYAHSAPAAEPFAPLRGEIRCDVCIVGGGLAGLSAAIELRRRGFGVVLLEGREIGWGASGRNGGQALAGLACDMAVVAAQLGPTDARRIWDLTVEGVRLIEARCAEFSIDCDWQRGALLAAVNGSKARALHAWCETIARDYGYAELAPIDGRAVREWIDSPRYAGAAFDAMAGHLHPLKFVRGLARAAASLGVAIHEQSPATAIDDAVPHGGKARVRTAAGDVRCDRVLLAGNVYLDALAPQLARRIMPVGTFIAASERLDAGRAARLIRGRAAVCDTQFVLDYFRLSADDRMLFGGRVSYSRIAPRDLAEAMRRRMLAVFPQLGDVAMEFAWGGYVDITMNRAPDFGRLAPNVYYLQGFSGHGVALSGLAGRIVAEAMAGDAGRFDLFARLRHRDFPGGPLLRTPALVLAMLWYRLRDLVG